MWMDLERGVHDVAVNWGKDPAMNYTANCDWMPLAPLITPTSFQFLSCEWP
jgi:hypothetical protein